MYNCGIKINKFFKEKIISLRKKLFFWRKNKSFKKKITLKKKLFFEEKETGERCVPAATYDGRRERSLSWCCPCRIWQVAASLTLCLSLSLSLYLSWCGFRRLWQVSLSLYLSPSLSLKSKSKSSDSYWALKKNEIFKRQLFSVLLVGTGPSLS